MRVEGHLNLHNSNAIGVYVCEGKGRGGEVGVGVVVHVVL